MTKPALHDKEGPVGKPVVRVIRLKTVLLNLLNAPVMELVNECAVHSQSDEIDVLTATIHPAEQTARLSSDLTQLKHAHKAGNE